VDEEISQISATLREMADQKELDLSLTILPSDIATFDAVKEAISTGDHHIIHYAGHAATSEKQPEKSYIRLRTEEGKRTEEVKEVNMPMTRRWFGDAESVRFVYLNCCMGAAQDSTEKLSTNDFLGIADTLIQARVPAVLGHRWPVEDSSAKSLSVSFYYHLLKYGRIDTALLYARREVADDDRDNRSWISPILILQS
jgi:CHAT domain-containing protein